MAAYSHCDSVPTLRISAAGDIGCIEFSRLHKEKAAIREQIDIRRLLG
jgi:hypothetical protein